jgi:hypothetical protein
VPQTLSDQDSSNGTTSRAQLTDRTWNLDDLLGEAASPPARDNGPLTNPASVFMRRAIPPERHSQSDILSGLSSALSSHVRAIHQRQKAPAAIAVERSTLLHGPRARQIG